LISVLSRIFEILSFKGAFAAMLTWKKFSLAAYKLLRRAESSGVNPRTVVDVGANIGQFSVAASRIFPQASIYPFEPDPEAAEKLKKNLPKTHLNNLRVLALGDFCGNTTFNINTDSQVNSILALGASRKEAFPSSTVRDKITVAIATLDSIFENVDLTSPILVKIDVQGFEDKVLLGGASFLKTVHWIIVEVSFTSLYVGEAGFTDIIDLLKENGFSFVRPLNVHYSPKTGEIIEMDALFEKV